MCSCDMDAMHSDLQSPSSSLESSSFLSFRTQSSLCIQAAIQPLTQTSTRCPQQQSVLGHSITPPSDASAQRPQHSVPIADSQPLLNPSIAGHTSSDGQTGGQVGAAKAFRADSPAAFAASPLRPEQVTGHQPPAAPKRKLPQQRFVSSRQPGNTSSIGLSSHSQTKMLYNGSYVRAMPPGQDVYSCPPGVSQTKANRSPHVRSTSFGVPSTDAPALVLPHQSSISSKSAAQTSHAALPLELCRQGRSQSNPSTKSAPAPGLLQSLLQHEEMQQSRGKLLQLQASRVSLAAELQRSKEAAVPLASTAGLLHRLALQRDN